MGREWTIYGEEHEIAEDTMEWKIDLPNVTEVMFMFLPFGSAKNDSNGFLNALLCDGEKNFDIKLEKTASEKASKIWNRRDAHVSLDNGMIFADSVVNSGYWDFRAIAGNAYSVYLWSPCETEMKKIDTLKISGVSDNKYIGAGSKIKIWAR